tara:strand:+ start:937 stop:1566 length:630 start_codon:yes stop_codon:yes gene_type:complete
MKIYIKKKISLVILLLITSGVSAEYRQGVDYQLINNPIPIKQDGIVEVTEFFWYACLGCYSFEPALSLWESKQKADVKLNKIPITWQGVHQLHAALYYTIESLKLDPSTHTAVFVTIHDEGNFLGSPKSIQEFLKKFGVAPELTIKYLNSFAVKQKVNRAIKYGKQLKVDGTPTMIVDGKYYVKARPNQPLAEMLNVVDYLVELQKPVS